MCCSKSEYPNGGQGLSSLTSIKYSLPSASVTTQYVVSASSTDYIKWEWSVSVIYCKLTGHTVSEWFG